MEDSKSFLKVGKPSHRLYSDFSIGRSGYNLSANIKVKEKRLNTLLWLSGNRHKENFDKLRSSCFECSVEKLGNGIIWERNDSNNSSWVIISYDADYTDKENWANQFMWFKENLEKFATFFKPEIAKI